MRSRTRRPASPRRRPPTTRRSLPSRTTGVASMACSSMPTWTMSSVIDEQVARIRAEVGDGRVLCALSGGVDSSVAAALVHRAVGHQLTCIYVDTGLMRKGESTQVTDTFRREMGIELIHVDAADR